MRREQSTHWDSMSDRQRDNIRRMRHTDFETCPLILGACEDCMAEIGVVAYPG